MKSRRVIFLSRLETVLTLDSMVVTPDVILFVHNLIDCHTSSVNIECFSCFRKQQHIILKSEFP